MSEIQRTARANGGRPLGSRAFAKATGIPTSVWYGKLWARWGDAVAEAGFSPNTANTAYPTEYLLNVLAAYVRELGRFPSAPEFRLKSRSDTAFPSHNAFARLGTQSQLAEMLLVHCRERDDLHDVLPMISVPSQRRASTATADGAASDGFVYLLRSGRFYKIGRSAAPGRREYEIGLQLPEAVELVHSIRTDDPAGIEAYWHSRFASKRKKGEWFDLASVDVAAFRRRTFM